MIEADRLSKFYGSKAAVLDLSFRIESGSVVGFLGLNGAGKTTTLRLLSGDLESSVGTVRIGGGDLSANPREVKRKIGFLPDQPPLYPEMSVHAYLRYAGAIRGMSGADLEARVTEVEKMVRVDEVANDLVSSLSHGYRQRLGIGQAIVHRPELVILDEPISGLDPVQIADMRELIRALGGQHTVLLSSHILTEISQTCDRILVMGKGRIIADGTEEELRRQLVRGGVVDVTVRGDATTVRGRLAGLDGVKSVEVLADAKAAEPGSVRLRVQAAGDVREAIARKLVEGGFGLLALGNSEHELEDVFVELTRDRSDSTQAKT